MAQQPVQKFAIHCSACGAGCDARATSCPYCHTVFSAADADLGRTCWSCFRQISAQTSYCRYCGALQSDDQASPGARAPLHCPRCKANGHDTSLMITRLGKTQFHALQCGSCAGQLFDPVTFHTVLAAARQEATALPDIQNGLQNGVQAGRIKAALKPEDLKVVYLKCPKCDELMNRVNYAKRSKVIIDVCRAHGVWCDADELGQLIDWILAGGLKRSEDADELEMRNEIALLAFDELAIHPSSVNLGDDSSKLSPEAYLLHAKEQEIRARYENEQKQRDVTEAIRQFLRARKS